MFRTPQFSERVGSGNLDVFTFHNWSLFAKTTDQNVTETNYTEKQGGMQDTLKESQDDYADIRPYTDAEVASVLERLGRSDELHRALIAYRFGHWPQWMQKKLVRLTAWQLRRHFAPVTTVDAFQAWLSHWINALVESTSSEVVITGLDQLDASQSYLWLSNHRDIAMDPTLIGYALMQSGWPTARIAIGDNLLGNSVLADLMKLNKSFIVKRSINDRREKLREFQRLSGYIRHSLDHGHSVWLAQRQGRAKDNLDYTDTAVLKMLALSGREEKISFIDTMSALRPVPVLVQFEWDPCDCLKARELVAREKGIPYEKRPGEDTESILTGLRGQKGRIRICFGQPLSEGNMTDADCMAQATDAEIESMKTYFPVNFAAVRLLQQDFGYSVPASVVYPTDIELPLNQLRARYHGQPDDVAVRLLKNYAAGLL
ncbi:1-acyl-sn-glycerol-3-phosphate acyltransferase [Thalassolituus maritimus]